MISDANDPIIPATREQREALLRLLNGVRSSRFPGDTRVIRMLEQSLDAAATSSSVTPTIGGATRDAMASTCQPARSPATAAAARSATPLAWRFLDDDECDVAPLTDHERRVYRRITG